MLTDLSPSLYGNFTDCCSDSSYFIPTLRTHICQTRSWQIYPLTSNCNDRFLVVELIFGRPSVGRSTPSLYGNFTDCCSDSSYFIPTLRAQHLADQVLADLPPSLYDNFTDCCSDSSYFIPTLGTHLWQTRCWQIYPQPPTSNGNDRFLV